MPTRILEVLSYLFGLKTSLAIPKASMSKCSVPSDQTFCTSMPWDKVCINTSALGLSPKEVGPSVRKDLYYIEAEAEAALPGPLNLVPHTTSKMTGSSIHN